MSPRLPGFKLHVFAEPASASALLQDAPSFQRALFVDGVPDGFIGRRYMSDSNIALFDRRRDEMILRFGTSGLSNPVGVDLATGHVVKIMRAEGFPLIFVNASIEQFTYTVREVLNRLPYYIRLEIDTKAEAVGTELLEIVRRVDAEAALPDRYWSVFIDDVKMGDLSTESIIELEGKIGPS